jgi:hypothetical protein
MDRVLLILDADEVSSRQRDMCKTVGCPGLRFIDCALPENEHAEVCHHVEAFPAWCDEERKTCAYGYGATLSECKALAAQAAAGSP